jgi:hypothetical protein
LSGEPPVTAAERAALIPWQQAIERQQPFRRLLIVRASNSGTLRF